jgi:hypothetical protein
MDETTRSVDPLCEGLANRSRAGRATPGTSPPQPAKSKDHTLSGPSWPIVNMAIRLPTIEPWLLAWLIPPNERPRRQEPEMSEMIASTAIHRQAEAMPCTMRAKITPHTAFHSPKRNMLAAYPAIPARTKGRRP